MTEAVGKSSSSRTPMCLLVVRCVAETPTMPMSRASTSSRADARRGVLLRDPELREDALLDGALIDADAPAKDLLPVDREVVLLRLRLLWIGVQERDVVLRQGCAERVVRERPPALGGALDEREVRDPEGVVLGRVGKSELRAEPLANDAEGHARRVVRVGHRECEITVPGFRGGADRGDLARGEELRDRRAHLGARERERDQSLRSFRLCESLPAVDVLPRRVCLAGYDEAAHGAP